MFELSTFDQTLDLSFAPETEERRNLFYSADLTVSLKPGVLWYFDQLQPPPLNTLTDLRLFLQTASDTPPVSSPSTTLFNLCDTVSAADLAHGRPQPPREVANHLSPGPRDLVQQKDPTPPQTTPPFTPSQGPLSLPNAASIAPRGSLTGTKRATYPPYFPNELSLGHT